MDNAEPKKTVRFVQTKDEFDPSKECGLCGAPLDACEQIERLEDELVSASNLADKFGSEREEARHVARHFYHEAISEGPQESDKEWLARNKWLEEVE